jgi:hypothetical protein
MNCTAPEEISRPKLYLQSKKEEIPRRPDLDENSQRYINDATHAAPDSQNQKLTHCAIRYPPTNRH